MFDLFRSRDKAVRYLIGGLLSIIALTMVITLIPGLTSPPQGDPSDNVIAEIGDETITVPEIRLQIDTLMREQRLPASMVPVYMPQVIEQSILERAMAFEAKRLGIQVSDEELAEQVKAALPSLFASGTLDKARYQDAVARFGYTIQQFEENLRKQRMLLRLTNMAEEGVVLPAGEVEREFIRRNGRMKIEYVAFNPEEVKKTLTADRGQLEALFNGNRQAYKLPERRDLTLLIADELAVAMNVKVDDAKLQAAYDQNRDRYRVPERAHVRHILVKTQGAPQDQIPALRKKADGLLAQVRGGADFAKLAKDHSEDPGSKDKGGEYWVTRGQMVKPFEDASFNMKPGASDIVTTEYGFHIMQVMERESARLKPISEVRDELVQQLKSQEVARMATQAIEQARAEWAKNPAQVEAIAQKYGLQLVKAEKAQAGKPLPLLGTANEVMATSFQLKLNEVSPVIEPQVGKKVVAQVNKIDPVKLAEFTDVEDEIRQNFMQVRSQEVAQKKAEGVLQKAKAGQAFGAAAKSEGGEMKAPPEFSMNGSIEGLGGAAGLADSFSQPVGAFVGPFNLAGQYVVARIVDKREPDMSQLAVEREGLSAQLKGKIARERSELFKDSVLNELIRLGKVKKHDATIQRLVRQYAGGA
jgi:peptidyl-prolyl cis-trans isomerase D